MLMKLAISSDKAQKKVIKDCCESNELEYLEIDDYKFGMLAQNPYESTYGKESEDSEENYNIKVFVDIYNCIKENWKKSRSIFQWNNKYMYEGLLLDNLFFYNLLKYSEKSNNIKFKSLEYITEFKTPVTLDDIDEARDAFKYRDQINIVKLTVIFGLGEEIIFTKNGYVEITATDKQFFRENKQSILDLLLVGIRDRYGQ